MTATTSMERTGTVVTRICVTFWVVRNIRDILMPTISIVRLTGTGTVSIIASILVILTTTRVITTNRITLTTIGATTVGKPTTTVVTIRESNSTTVPE